MKDAAEAPGPLTFALLRLLGDEQAVLLTRQNILLANVALIVALGGVARSGMEVPVDGMRVDAMEFAASYLYEWGKRLVGEPQTGAT